MINGKKIALVLPTCRVEGFLKFHDKWKESIDARFPECVVDTVYVIYDGPDAPNQLLDLRESGNIKIYCWQDTDEHENTFSKKDSAIRSYGFYLAHKEGHDMTVTLDDDCLPYEIIGNPVSNTLHFFRGHYRALYDSGFKSCNSSLTNVHTRGLPYRFQSELDVHLNMGMWFNVPDFDAIHQLSIPEYNHSNDVTRVPILLPHNQYVPMCGMNLAFRTEITPLMYFPLMGQGVPFGRFDDIWCGLFCFKIMKQLSLNITYGPPFVDHSKASDPFNNLRKESPGILVNEKLWEFVISYRLSSSTMMGLYSELTEAIWNEFDFLQDDTSYENKLHDAMINWIDLYHNLKIER